MDDRINAVAHRLADYVKSPSLRHIRDPHSLYKLAKEIVLAVDRAGSIWQKWEGPREGIAKSAVPCWVPIEDLVTFLNRLPGPTLTRTDVTQRLLAFHEEPYCTYPDEDLKAGCLAIYEAEKAQGTELTAIIGALREHIELEEERIRHEREEAFRRHKDEEWVRLRQRFLAGADCGWTQIEKSTDVYFCRRNGRAYRVVRSKDKKWNLHRVETLEESGALIGTYQGRRDASKALDKIAYEPEPRW
jgi:hypothetical protein